MPGRTGLEIIRDLAAAVPEGERPQVLMMTAHATVENAIEAMKLGAYDYLQKPFEVDELLVAVRRALEHQSLSRQHRYLLSEREEDFDHYGIVGQQPGGRGAAAQDRAGGAVEEHGARHRGDRHRQGARGAGHPRPQRPARHAAHQGELRGHPRGPPRVGALRPRQGRLHRRHREPPGPLRPRRRGDDLPRRDRHPRPARAGEAAARPAGARVRAGGLGAHGVGGRARDRGHEPRPAGDGRGRALPGGPLLPPERHPGRAAAAAREAGGRPAARRALRAQARAADGAADRRRRAQRPSSGSRPTAGRATCGSSRTRSRGRWSSRRGP